MLLLELLVVQVLGWPLTVEAVPLLLLPANLNNTKKSVITLY